MTQTQILLSKYLIGNFIMIKIRVYERRLTT